MKTKQVFAEINSQSLYFIATHKKNSRIHDNVSPLLDVDVGASDPHMSITCDGTCGWAGATLYGSNPQYGYGWSRDIGMTTCKAARNAGIIPATGGTYEVRATPTGAPL